jgi:predicted nucleic acid-binding protein
LQALDDPATVLTAYPLDRIVADNSHHIPRATVPDMPDRIIAATALTLGLPLITRDGNIRKLTNITTIW